MFTVIKNKNYLSWNINCFNALMYTLKIVKFFFKKQFLLLTYLRNYQF